MLSSEAIADAYLLACRAELDALKPGNVHRFAGGHGMDVGVFEQSAVVSAPAIAAAGAPAGARVLTAVEATWAAVGMNTNLGILLLAAPLAAATERVGAEHGAGPARGSGIERLRAAVGGVLGDLTPDDAADAFRAIARASPGGLGTDGAHDVRAPPRIGLVEAMRIAAPRDLVARQYADGFAGIFDVGLPALAAARQAGEIGMWPAIACFLTFAEGFPDSHVGRKFGSPTAEALQAEMSDLRRSLAAFPDRAAREAALLGADTRLKQRGLNPGTSADLTVTSLFTEELVRRLEECGPE